MHKSTKLNYVEFGSLNLDASKTFFTSAFGWCFTDYGNEYSAFSNAGLDGGIFASERVIRAESGAPLLVLYAADIAKSQVNIESAGGTITKPLFDFPGGCRFHFVEPGGNELAVWSETA